MYRKFCIDDFCILLKDVELKAEFHSLFLFHSADFYANSGSFESQVFR